jgi:hypothetical protein
MAEHKGPRVVPPRKRESSKEVSEKSPNPHGESKVLQMPVRTQQRNETSGKNIPKVPNTVGGNLNPSVAHDFEKRAVKPRNPTEKRTDQSKAPRDINRKDA